jgi:hypothetical protein
MQGYALQVSKETKKRSFFNEKRETKKFTAKSKASSPPNFV